MNIYELLLLMLELYISPFIYIKYVHVSLYVNKDDPIVYYNTLDLINNDKSDTKIVRTDYIPIFHVITYYNPIDFYS